MVFPWYLIFIWLFLIFIMNYFVIRSLVILIKQKWQKYQNVYVVIGFCNFQKQLYYSTKDWNLTL